MSEYVTLTLNSPITEEQWDEIADYELEHTDRIYFTTKKGKEVEFVKPKTGHWINEGRFANYHGGNVYRCSRCGNRIVENEPDDFCKHCGSDNRVGELWV